MPSKKDIDKLKDKLNSLGNDPAYKGSTWEATQKAEPEENEKLDDISALLDNFPADINADTEPPDLDSFSLPQDIGGDDPGKTDDFELPDLGSGDLSASGEEKEDDFELPDLNLGDLSAPGGEKEDDFELPPLDSEDLSADVDNADTEEKEDLENIFGDDSIELDDNPDALLDRFSEQEGGDGSTDDFEIGSLDDIFEGTEPGADSEKEEDFELPDLGSDDLPSLDGEKEDDFELPDLGSDDLPTLDGEKEEDFELPDLGSDDLPTLDGEKEEDFELPDLGSDDLPSLDGEKEDDFELPDLGSDDLPSLDGEKEEDFELPDLGSDDLPALDGEKEEDFELPDLGSDDLPSLDGEKEEDFELPDLGSDDLPTLDGEKEEDFELPDLGSDDLPTLDGEKEEDFELPDLGSDDLPTLDGEKEEDFELPDLGSDDLPALDAEKEDEFELPSLDSGDVSDGAKEEEEFELPSLDSEDLSLDKDFDIGSLDSISVDDEFEKKEEESLVLDETETQETPALSNDFNLEDLGDKFGSIDDLEDTQPEDLSEKAVAKPEGGRASVEERSEKFYISAEKLKRVVETLSSYPGNLKFYIEDLIGNKDIPRAYIDNIVDKVAAGASAREVTELLFKLTGKRIRIPAHYQRKTWQELEREKGTLAYIIKYRVAPFAGKALAVSFALLFLLFLINNFVRKPIHSTLLYNRGYEALRNGNFAESERNFLRASRIRPARKQFYRYANAYIEKREFGLAEIKYLQLLGISLSSERQKPPGERHRGFFPGDKRGFIDYSVLKTFFMGNFSSASRIIEDFLDMPGNKWDYDMLLRKIDNYLNWAVIDNSKYDNAAFTINDSISRFGQRHDLYLRKIAHAVRSGRLLNLRNEAFSNTDDILPGGVSSAKIRYYALLGHYRGYLEELRRRHVDPYIAADFYGFLLAHEVNIDGIDNELVRIATIDRTLLEPHFHLASFWNMVGRPEFERRSLQIVERLAEAHSIDHIRTNYPHSYMYAIRQRKHFEIMALNRLGNFEREDQNIIAAQSYYQRAISEYERNIDILGLQPKYGRLYEDYGDLYFYDAGKFNEALRQFLRAEATGHREDNLSYKIGFIYYRNNNFREASERFYEISLNQRNNPSALFAFANASFLNSVFSPAMAYYENLLELLEIWRGRQAFIEIDRRRDHQFVMQRIMEVHNNLGATLYRMSERTQNQAYYTRALVHLTRSAELYDFMARNPETVVRTFTRPLSQLNIQFALLNAGRPIGAGGSNVAPYSVDNLRMDGPLIYTEIDMDLFGRVELLGGEIIE